MYDANLFDDVVLPGPIVGARFEAMYEPEWDAWCILDRENGQLHECEDRGSAVREAASLELVSRLVNRVARHFAVV